MESVYLSEIANNLGRIADALEESNEMIRDLGGKDDK